MNELDEIARKIREDNEAIPSATPVVEKEMRNCVVCGNPFEPKWKVQKVCSDECKKARQAEAMRKYYQKSKKAKVKAVKRTLPNRDEITDLLEQRKVHEAKIATINKALKEKLAEKYNLS